MVKQIINKGDILAVLSTGKRLILYLRFFFLIKEKMTGETFLHHEQSHL